MEIAGEMQVDVFHGHNLRIAAARRTTLHAKARPKRWFTQRHDGAFADLVQAVTQSHRRRRLAFAGRCRVDRRHQNELAILLGGQTINVFQFHLGLGVAIGNEISRRNTQLRPNLHDRLHLGFAGNFNIRLDVRRSGHLWLSSGELLLN